MPLSPGPLFADFVVVDVRWRIPASTPPSPHRITRIGGSGLYAVGGEFAVEQQLALDLAIGDQGSFHADSGLALGGGQFPARIDAPVSTGGTCFERSIDVHAQQRPSPAGVTH